MLTAFHQSPLVYAHMKVDRLSLQQLAAIEEQHSIEVVFRMFHNMMGHLQSRTVFRLRMWGWGNILFV